MIGKLKQAQVISVCIFVCGIVLYILLRNRAKKKGTYGAETAKASESEKAETVETAEV